MEADRIQMLYVAGFNLPTILNVASDLRNRDLLNPAVPSQKQWVDLVDFMAHAECQVYHHAEQLEISPDPLQSWSEPNRRRHIFIHFYFGLPVY